jgi:tetratricopeptide (TPR) repeat protein
MPVLQNPLRDNFEKACQQTEDPNQREFIALDAVSFLIKSTKPDEVSQIDKEIQKEIDKEKDSSDGLPPLPDNGAQMNDDLCAKIEARLASFLAAIARLKKSPDSPVIIGLFARAKVLGQKVDAWRRYDYWAGLVEFLQNSTTDQWRSWRSAAIAQQKARFAIADGDFTNAKLYAVYGLQKLAPLRDHKLYLDLCSRLENAIAEGQDACWRLATALGYWVIKESVNARHYLREVGMRHNLGNQLFIAGKNKEAMAVLQQAQQSCKQYTSIQDMDYYYINLLERPARAYLNGGTGGDVQKATDYLENYGYYAQQPREKTLLHLGKGYLALYNQKPDEAKTEFTEACSNAQDQDGGNASKDFFNLWSAYMSLGIACMKLGQIAEALDYLNKSRQHGAGKDFLKNPDRAIHNKLMEAQIEILKKNAKQAEDAITEAQNIFTKSLLDSPRREIQLLLTEASLRLLQGNADKAQELQNKALEQARKNGFNAPNVDLLAILIFG